MYILQNVIDWEHLASNPVKHYMALATAKALTTLDGKGSLEQPLMVYCLLYRDTGYGYFCLMLDYMEEGFESAGIEISYQAGEEAKVVRLPLPAGIFESGGDRQYITTVNPLIAFPGKVTITSDGIEIATLSRALEPEASIILPFSILEEPAYISVYTKDGDKSHPMRLALTEDVRDYIQKIRSAQETAPDS